MRINIKMKRLFIQFQEEIIIFQKKGHNNWKDSKGCIGCYIGDQVHSDLYSMTDYTRRNK